MKSRYNLFEQQTLEVINRWIRIELCFEGNNDVNWVEMWKRGTNKAVLFQDADSPYKTISGNPRVTEFVLYVPSNGINWRIECKSQLTNSSMNSRVYYELLKVEELKEDKLILVLGGALTDHRFLLDVNKTIQQLNIGGRVWVGSLKDFEYMLIKTLTPPKK